MSKLGDLDTFLQDQNQATDPASQPENNNGSNSGEPNQIEQPGGQSEEEVEFNTLSGSAQDRFRKVYRDLKEKERQLQMVAEGRGVLPPPPPGGINDNPAIKDAKDKLTNIVGLADKDYVRSEVRNGLAAIRYEYELTRLENLYEGNDGRPKFTREEYEDFVSRHPNLNGYAPEDVYRYKMYPEELKEWELGHAGQQFQRAGSSSLRPTRTNRVEEELTPEKIEENLQKFGQAWYDKNIDKINEVMNKQGQ